MIVSQRTDEGGKNATTAASDRDFDAERRRQAQTTRSSTPSGL